MVFFIVKNMCKKQEENNMNIQKANFEQFNKERKEENLLQKKE